MKRINTSPISGMQELLPSAQAVFNHFKSTIEKTYKAHGFLSIETPTIDRSEILFAKAGNETEKQIYKVIKTGDSASTSTEALRFDHTVPLARYVVEHESALSFPFKATQIGRNFRGERAQKGRFREFYQCDIDIIGRNSLALANDAEIIVTLSEAISAIGLDDHLIRISNRKLLSGFLEALNLSSLSSDILSIIDHSEKLPEEKTLEALDSLKLTKENVVKITSFMNISGDSTSVEKKLSSLKIKNSTFKEGKDELLSILRLLESQGLSKKAIASLNIVRGLDYYTGTVFETILPAHPEVGSVCSGGRYDNLASFFTDQSLPGVGGSIGLTRLFSALMLSGLINSSEISPIDYAIIPLDSQNLDYCFSLASRIRDKGKTVDLVLTDKKLGDKLRYASSVAKYGLIIGENEVATSEIMQKDFATGESTPFSI